MKVIESFVESNPCYSAGKKIDVKGADRIFQILLGVIACICIYNALKDVTLPL